MVHVLLVRRQVEQAGRVDGADPAACAAPSASPSNVAGCGHVVNRLAVERHWNVVLASLDENVNVGDALSLGFGGAVVDRRLGRRHVDDRPRVDDRQRVDELLRVDDLDRELVLARR